MLSSELIKSSRETAQLAALNDIWYYARLAELMAADSSDLQKIRTLTFEVTERPFQISESLNDLVALNTVISKRTNVSIDLEIYD